MNKHLLYVCGIAILFGSCENKPKHIYIDTDYTTENVDTGTVDDFAIDETESVIVPYREENGVKVLDVKVNGLGLNMIFDTGCSGTLISVAEVNYLYQKGLLSQDDILGTSQSMIADGSIVENAVVNLKEVVVADKISCPNVQATVSNNVSAPLLLGNEVLNRTASYTIDNLNKTIIFKLK